MKSSQEHFTQPSQKTQTLQPADTAMIDAAIDREVRCQEGNAPEGREDLDIYYTSPSPPVKACHNMSIEWDAIAAQVQGGCSLEGWDVHQASQFPRENSIAFPDLLEFPNVG